MSKREVTYPKYLTARNVKKLIGMKLIYTGSNDGPLSGRVISIDNQNKGTHGRVSLQMTLAIDWKAGTTEHTGLAFGQLKYLDKNTIKGESYSEITFYPNGYPVFDCNLCKSKCKAQTPCDLYESVLKR